MTQNAQPPAQRWARWAGILPLAIVIAALVLSWFYSAPPVSLHNAPLRLLPLLALGGLPALVVPCCRWPARQMVRVRAGAYRDPARWDSLAFGGLALVIGTALAETAALLLLSLID